MGLNGKTAIVTGGGRDIGCACVLRLAEEGASIAINYHSSGEGADSGVAEIKAAGGKAFALQRDMTNPANVERLVDQTRSEFGDSIDSLARVTGGLVARKTCPEVDVAHWNKVMDLNVTSFFHLAKAATPHMPGGSSIVAFASQTGRDGGDMGACVDINGGVLFS